MGLSADLTDFLQSKLSSVLNQPLQITGTKPVSGGSINQTYCIDTNIGKYMLKFNSKSAYPNMFACESIGLKTIADTNTIPVPQVILQDDLDDESFLLLEWIETRKPTERASELLGRQLAEMHRNSADYFGFEGNNYMGSLTQSNKKHDTWSSFFVEERLLPMVKLAFEKRLLNKADVQNFEKLYSKLGKLFKAEPPSLIHGDLWGGNYLISTDEKPYLIDPAVSYGDREFDIAMTTLFGGFSESFYAAYNESFPLNKGWNERIELWNLYPLLLHLNLFGAGYLEQVREGVEEYI